MAAPEDLATIGNFIAAASALGTASFGLVDATKALGGGISRIGFGRIRAEVTRVIGHDAEGMVSDATIFTTLHANWLNGVAKSDQKAAARALIRMRITPGNAPALARAANIDEASFRAVAVAIEGGRSLAPEQITLLGRFDATVSAALDAGYERADQQYRNGSKLAALVVSVTLAIIGGTLVGSPVLVSVFVGLVATPLAPIAKDLTTSLSAAVKAIGAARR